MHNLIYSGSPNKIADHETSQSSERDVLRQRFSVATHPHLSIFLCSDGYSVTVLKLPSIFSLPSLLFGIVNEARFMLNLPLMAMQRNVKGQIVNHGSLSEEHDDSTFSFGKSAQLHNLQEFTATFEEDTIMEETLESSGGPDFFSKITGADAGEIYFAGLGSTLELTSQTQVRVQDVRKALPLLLCGWGLLLSSGCVYPGDGIQKSIPFAVEACQSMLLKATNLLISTVVSAIDTLCKDGAVETTPTISNFVEMLLSLVPLDSLKQGYLNTVTILTNGILSTMSRECVREHSTFKDKTHSLKAMAEYFKSATWTMDQISDILDNVVALLETTYSQLPVNNHSLLFYAPGSFAPTSLPAKFCLARSSLSPAYNTLASVLSLLSQDTKTARRIIKKKSKKASHTSCQESKEIIVLCNNVTTCLNNTVVALQYLNGQVRYELEKQAEKPSSYKDSNPITSPLQEDSKISQLASKLAQCDITGALEYAHILIKDYNIFLGHTVSTSSLTVSIDSKEAILLLARVMVDYFCEEGPVLEVSVAAPFKHFIVLKRQELLKSLCQEDVSESWNVDFTLQLLLITHSWREACDFLLKLGDWKKVFLLAVVVCHHSQLMTMSKEEEYAQLKQFVHHVVEGVVFEALGLNIKNGSIYIRNGQPSGHSAEGHCSTVNHRLVYNSRHKPSGSLQPLDKETISFVSETLKVCAFADIDSVLLTISAAIVSEIAHCCKQLSAEVPSAIFLPGPPLFCPQPAVEKEVN